jgi:hypothetical protein
MGIADRSKKMKRGAGARPIPHFPVVPAFGNRNFIPSRSGFDRIYYRPVAGPDSGRVLLADFEIHGCARRCFGRSEDPDHDPPREPYRPPRYRAMGLSIDPVVDLPDASEWRYLDLDRTCIWPFCSETARETVR